MKIDYSRLIRKHGDEIAFDHGQWEFQSRQFAYSAKHLLCNHIEMIKREEYEGIALLPTSQFLISLAIELIGKAYYLKAETGPKENIYRHEVLSLCQGIPLDSRQKELMQLAESNVVWAGRYPTPKWTKEQFKEAYDVPCTVKNGVEYIEAESMKNSSSLKRMEELLGLYDYLRSSWIACN